MSKIIVKNVVEREPGYLYFVDGSGNLCSAKMKNYKGVKKKAPKKKVAKKTTKKKTTKGRK